MWQEIEVGCLVHSLIPFLRAIGISRVESVLLIEDLSPVTWGKFEIGRISELGEDDWPGSILVRMIFCLREYFLNLVHQVFKLYQVFDLSD